MDQAGADVILVKRGSGDAGLLLGALQEFLPSTPRGDPLRPRPV
jgi:hypothetical protein